MGVSVQRELNDYAQEQAARAERLRELMARARDPSLTMELRLKAVHQVTAMIWAIKSRGMEVGFAEPDKIERAKKRAELNRAARARAKLIAAGGKPRPRRNFKAAVA